MLRSSVLSLPLTVENHVFDSSHALKPSVADQRVYSLLKGLSKCYGVYARTARLSSFTLTAHGRYERSFSFLFCPSNWTPAVATRFRLPATYLVDAPAESSFYVEI